VDAEEFLEWFALVGGVEELSSSTMTGPLRCRSNSRRKNTDLFLGDVVVEEQIIEAQSLSLRA
jgi:hypothetical protein